MIISSLWLLTPYTVNFINASNKANYGSYSSEDNEINQNQLSFTEPSQNVNKPKKTNTMEMIDTTTTNPIQTRNIDKSEEGYFGDDEEKNVQIKNSIIPSTGIDYVIEDETEKLSLSKSSIERVESDFAFYQFTLPVEDWETNINREDNVQDLITEAEAKAYFEIVDKAKTVINHEKMTVMQMIASLKSIDLGVAATVQEETDKTKSIEITDNKSNQLTLKNFPVDQFEQLTEMIDDFNTGFFDEKEEAVILIPCGHIAMFKLLYTFKSYQDLSHFILYQDYSLEFAEKFINFLKFLGWKELIKFFQNFNFFSSKNSSFHPIFEKFPLYLKKLCFKGVTSNYLRLNRLIEIYKVCPELWKYLNEDAEIIIDIIIEDIHRLFIQEILENEETRNVTFRQGQRVEKVADFKEYDFVESLDSEIVKKYYYRFHLLESDHVKKLLAVDLNSDADYVDCFRNMGSIEVMGYLFENGKTISGNLSPLVYLSQSLELVQFFHQIGYSFQFNEEWFPYYSSDIIQFLLKNGYDVQRYLLKHYIATGNIEQIIANLSLITQEDVDFDALAGNYTSLSFFSSKGLTCSIDIFDKVIYSKVRFLKNNEIDFEPIFVHLSNSGYPFNDKYLENRLKGKDAATFLPIIAKVFEPTESIILVIMMRGNEEALKIVQSKDRQLKKLNFDKFLQYASDVKNSIVTMLSDSKCKLSLSDLNQDKFLHAKLLNELMKKPLQIVDVFGAKILCRFGFKVHQKILDYFLIPCLNIFLLDLEFLDAVYNAGLSFSPDMMDETVKKLNVRLVQFLYSKGMRCSDKGVNAAVLAGNFEVVKFLYSIGMQLKDIDVFNSLMKLKPSSYSTRITLTKKFIILQMKIFLDQNK